MRCSPATLQQHVEQRSPSITQQPWRDAASRRATKTAVLSILFWGRANLPPTKASRTPTRLSRAVRMVVIPKDGEWFSVGRRAKGGASVSALARTAKQAGESEASETESEGDPLAARPARDLHPLSPTGPVHPATALRCAVAPSSIRQSCSRSGTVVRERVDSRRTALPPSSSSSSPAHSPRTTAPPLFQANFKVQIHKSRLSPRGWRKLVHVLHAPLPILTVLRRDGSTRFQILFALRRYPLPHTHTNSFLCTIRRR